MIKFFRKIRQKMRTENLPAGRVGKFSNIQFMPLAKSKRENEKDHIY